MLAPIVRRSVLLPDMFEPLIKTARVSPPRRRSLAIAADGFKRGCETPSPSKTTPFSSISGNGSDACSYAYEAIDKRASYSPIAANHRAIEGPVRSLQASIASEKNVDH